MSVSLLVAVSALLLAQDNHDPGPTALAVATGFDANRALITRGSFSLTYSVGTADDLEAALSGKWSDRTDATGEFVMDLPHARYDQLFDTKDLIAKRVVRGGGYSTRLVSGRVLTDGRVTLEEDIAVGALPSGDALIRRLTIRRGTLAFQGLAHVPLSLGTTSPEGLPSQLIRDAVEGRHGWRIASVKLDSMLEGVPTAEVTIEAGPTGRGRLWFDLKRGAVLRQIRHESTDGKQFNIERYDDLREIPGGAWLPFRRTDLNQDKLATQLTLRDAKFGPPPNRDSFRLKLLKPEAVFDEVAMTRYAPRDSWDLAALPSPRAPGNDPILDRSSLVSPTLMPGELQPWPTWAIVFMGGGIVLALVATMSYWRRRRA